MTGGDGPDPRRSDSGWWDSGWWDSDRSDSGDPNPSAPDQRAARVRVTAPRSSAAPAPSAPSLSRELAEQSEVGSVLLGSLVRSQLRLGIIVAGAFLTCLGGLGALAALGADLPWLPGLPLPWLLLAILPYPAAVVCAALYARASARNEEHFAELLRDEQ
ncbi:hypothetical protein [Sinomonas sp. P47F7]|uniref:hypothetical protein n=1 Tax=Sinomonas sp. P47F7 TaxID=3410987 RepID=UPI003BF55645